MHMDWQTVINLIGGVVVATGGWFARELWDALKELRRDIHKIERDLPEIYTRKDEFRESVRDVKSEMNSRFDKLENMIGLLHERLNDKADR